MPYKYDKTLFPHSVNCMIDNAIKRKIDEKILDIITQLDKDGKPVFSEKQMYELLIGVNYGLTHEDIKRCANPVFSYKQMRFICDMLGAKSKIKLEDYDKGVELITQLKKDGTPSFNAAQMELIYGGLTNGLNYEKINIYAELDKNKKPIYNHSRMRAIMRSLLFLSGPKLKFSLEQINLKNSHGKYVYNKNQLEQMIDGLHIFSQSIKNVKLYMAIKNDVPVFNADQMRTISNACRKSNLKIIKPIIEAGDYSISKMDYRDMYHFFNGITSLNEEEIKPIVKAIIDGFDTEQLFIITDNFLSARERRIFKSLINDKSDTEALKMVRNNLKKVPIKNRYDYLRECKYYLQCAKFFNVSETLIVNNLYLSDMQCILLESLPFDKEKTDIFDLCLKHKMPPDQINFISDSTFKTNEARNIAMALLSGANFDKIKNDHELAKSVLGDSEIASDIANDFDLYAPEQERFEL